MKIYHGPWFIFFSYGKTFKVKEVIIRIWITAMFAFLCFVAIKIAASVEISCNCNGKVYGFG